MEPDQRQPPQLSEAYCRLWGELQTGEQRVYNEVRDRFNDTADPCDFFFLLRTCRVGAVEFSQQGRFITPYHLGELGLEPKFVDMLLADWHGNAKDQREVMIAGLVVWCDFHHREDDASN